jgi:hypothetical protein
MARPKTLRAGSALPVVLFFSIAAVITVIAFVAGQNMIARRTFISPSELQALLNARSGIWKGLELLTQPKNKDTLKTINTLDSLFGKSLFGKPTENILDSENELVPDSSPIKMQPYSSDSFGTCEIALSYSGCFEMLMSNGSFRNSKKNVVVKLGGLFALSMDTVLYLESGPPLQTPIRGKVHYGPLTDTARTLRTKDLNEFIATFTRQMTDSLDTMKPALPLLIQHNDEFEKIPAVVRGALFIDGLHFDLSWKSTKCIVVHGDLQITKKVLLEGLTFLVTGEIKLFDDAQARNVSLYCLKKLTIGDRAVFSGTAISQTNILAFGSASVENKSLIFIPHTAQAQAPPKEKKGGPPALPKRDAPEKKAGVFSATFTESATIDATVITLNDTMGVKIDKNAVVKGIIRTKGALVLDGKLLGLAQAAKIVDGGAVMSGKPLLPIAVIKGSILPIDDVRRYYFPFFMGNLSILSWEED